LVVGVVKGVWESIINMQVARLYNDIHITEPKFYSDFRK
jgi:hypothetical protein